MHGPLRRSRQPKVQGSRRSGVSSRLLVVSEDANRSAASPPDRALGLHVPPFLASASSDLDAWSGRCKRESCDPRIRLKELDAAPLIEGARLEVGEGLIEVNPWSETRS